MGFSITAFSLVYHSGTIASNETWYAVDNPHIITGNIAIADGAMVIIEPGSYVEFSGVFTFTVYGTLVANGTENDHITITSGQTSPSNGDWQYIHFYYADGINLLDYCDITYGGLNYGNVYISGASDVTVGNCTIGYSATNGIAADAGSNPNIWYCSMYSNSQYGVYTFDASTNVELTAANITNNSGPAVRLSTQAIGLLNGMSMAGNVPNEIEVISGSLTADALWDDLYPYHILGNITVPDGTTLSLAPGTEWKFGGNYILNVYGTLFANGTPADRIFITSNQNSPSNGDWQYIYFYYPDGVNVMNYCDISYGGYSYGNVYTVGTGDITISNCNIFSSATNGLSSSSGSSPVVTNSAFFANSQFGIYTYDASTNIDISGGSISNNAGPAMLLSTAAVGLLDGISMSGNNPDEIQVISDSFDADATWDDIYPYHILGNMTIPDGITLTLSPGVTWKFGGNYVFTIYGTLNANGTAGNHITITSNQTVPAAGDWQYMYFYNSDGVNVLNYCDISYGGYSYGNIYTAGTGDITVSNCNISNSATNGLSSSSGNSPTISNCSVFSNSEFGIYTHDASTDININGGNITNNSGPAMRLSAAAVGLMDAMTMSGNTPDEIQVIADNFDASATWDDLYPYHILGNMTISDGITLTLSPGITWKFGGNYTFNIFGTLNANGTAGNHITITSNQAVPTAGDWQYLYFLNSDGVNILNYCDISYGGFSYGNVFTSGAGDISITNCNISYSATNGVSSLTGSSPNIMSCSVTNNNNHGINIDGGSSPNITNCDINSNGSFGIYTTDAASNANISGGSVTGNSSSAIRISAAAVGLLDGMTMSGNNPDEIQVIGDNIITDAIWDDIYPYHILGGITILDAVTLTLVPGVAWKFGGNYVLTIYGTFVADGTAGNHISFTSNQAVPAAGDWQFMYFYYPDGTNILNYCDISYGGYSFGNVYTVGTGDVTISNCTISNSATHGISSTSGSSPNVTDCSFSSNSQYGIYTYDAGTNININGGSFTGNSGPALRLSAAAVGLADGITMSGNNPDEIQVIADNISADATWDDSYPYHILGGMTILDAVTLTLAPGVVWKFGGNYVFTIYGTLVANGTAGNHITITSNQTVPAAGDWQFMYFYYPDGVNILNYCDISYGGYSYGNIYSVGASDITISNCNISNSATNGLSFASGSSPVVSDCSISNNSGNGIDLSGSFPFLTNNQIINNVGNGILNASNSNPVFGADISQWNDIYGNGTYNFYNNTNLAINTPFVYWGDTDSATIAATIYDFYDMGSLGIVNFNPWTNASHNVLYPSSGYYVYLKVFLEGAFNGIGMDTDLNPANIPLSQPFNTPPWNYTGSESVASIPSADIVDWCLIELRDAPDATSATPGTKIAQQAAFIKRNGSVVDLNGYIIPNHTATVSNNLFMVISHRNHLCIMSANPLSGSGNIYPYDFTSPAGQAYGTDAQKDFGGGVYGMYSGDVNANGVVDFADKTAWENQAGNAGYLSGDLNLDSQTDNNDKNDLWLPNDGESCQVPGVVAFSCGNPFIDSRDGQSYNTIQIGTQCWMAENLNIGSMILGSNDQSDNSSIEKYCYDDIPGNCGSYGGLYQWDEIMEYTTIPGIQGICPTDWHIPTDEEWCTLENEVDAGMVSCSQSGWRGLDAAGNLKETGTLHWITPNTGATNSSGFTALPGGERYYFNSSFFELSEYAHFWSSNETAANSWAHVRILYFNSAQVLRSAEPQDNGYSVRCVRD